MSTEIERTEIQKAKAEYNLKHYAKGTLTRVKHDALMNKSKMCQCGILVKQHNVSHHKKTVLHAVRMKTLAAEKEAIAKTVELLKEHLEKFFDGQKLGDLPAVEAALHTLKESEENLKRKM